MPDPAPRRGDPRRAGGRRVRVLSANPTATPQQMRDALVNGATSGKVTGISKKPCSTTPNKLLHLAPGA